MAIQKLSSEVVDQIAAGEVVERPSHLVKELVENSVDAGSTEIEVEYENGGRYVRVSDNGSGISKDELHLALNRHATSKLSSADDLWSLHSFGFRGEALASISAVSRLTLTSKKQNTNQAYQIVCEYGHKTDPIAVGAEIGTTIVIEELFQNVPARLKFLKSDSAEGTQIKNVLKALALSNPHVSFRVRTKGKLLFFWPSINDENKDQAYLKRAEQVLDQEKLYLGRSELLGFNCRVALSAPNCTVKSSRNIWIFVQGRWVQDRSLQAALMDSYRSLLMHGEFPICAVWVDCEPDIIDVNIHPTKSQVKFETPSNAFRVVLRATRSTLEQAPWVSDLLTEEVLSPHTVTKSIEQKEVMQPRSFESEEFNTSHYKQKTDIDTFSKNIDPAPTEEFSFSFRPVQKNTTEEVSNNTFEDTTETSICAKPTVASPVKKYWSNLQVLGQANLTYILAQSDDAVIFVDQHAAHERVAYERLMKGWKSGQIDVQRYLLPLTVDLDEGHIEAIKSHIPELIKLGIEVQISSSSTVDVVSAPSLVNEKSLNVVLRKMAQELMEHSGSFAMEKHISDICATLACHSVVRAGQALSKEEMQSLLAQMDEFALSSFCPHGRPVYVEYPYSKLEKDFGRIV